jgi:hypothetical protein
MKISKKLNQVVAGTLSAGVLMTSCTQYPYIEEDRLYGNIVVNDSDLGEIAIPISLQIKPEHAEYIKTIQQTTTDILNNPKKAKEFKENPSSYLKKQGYEGEINLDDNLLKITMALADEDINNSVQTKDFKTFLKLCADKNLISSSKGIFEDEYYKDQINKIYEQKDFKNFEKSLLRSNPNEVNSFFLPAAVVIAAAAAVVAAVWAYLAVHVYLYAYEYEYTKTGTHGGGLSSDINDFSVIDVYALKNGMEDTYIAVDKYSEEIVEESISAINEIQPGFFNNNSETEVRNLIKVNILNSLTQN